MEGLSKEDKHLSAPDSLKTSYFEKIIEIDEDTTLETYDNVLAEQESGSSSRKDSVQSLFNFFNQ